MECLSAGDKERINNAKDRAAAEAAVSSAQGLICELAKKRDAEAARVAAEAAASALRGLGIEVELVAAPAAANTTIERRYNAELDDAEVRRLWSAPDAPPADPGTKRNDQMRRKAIADAMNLTLAQVTRAVDKLGLKIP